jgi:hypothetical protein
VQRLALIDRICEGYGLKPSEAVAELDNDPERLAIVILEMRAYAQAKHAFDHAKNKIDDLKHWDGNPTMSLVELHTFERREAQLAAQLEADRQEAES